MSIVSYFCISCLSTDRLCNISLVSDMKSCADILKDLFAIHLESDEDDENYICEECSQRLKDANKLKQQVLETLAILEGNGLLKLVKENSNVYIKRDIGELSSDTDEKIHYEDIDDHNIYKVEVVTEEDSTLKIESKVYVNQDYEETVLELPHSDSVKKENHLSNSPKHPLYDTAKQQKAIQEEISETKIDKDSNTPVYKERKRRVVKNLVQHRDIDLTCKECLMELPNQYVYHRHMNEHFPNHICESCGKGFLSQKRLKRHQESHREGLFKCSECDMVFRNYNTMNSHRRRHSATLPYRCRLCPARLASLSARAAHLRSAHDAPPPSHACRLCGHRCLLAGNLLAHMRRTHLKERRHWCDDCGRGFYCRSELRAHRATHSQRPFVCDQCPKAYARKKALVVHLRSHSQEKPFPCNLCDKKFTQKCVLQRHLRVHEKRKDIHEKNVRVEEIEYI